MTTRRTPRLRATRAALATGLAVALAAAPSAAGAADRTPPTAPRGGQAWFETCYQFWMATWSSSTDNVDVQADLRYRVYDAHGRQLNVVVDYTTGATLTEVPLDQRGSGWIDGVPSTIRAVDRAGNLSASTAL